MSQTLRSNLPTDWPAGAFARKTLLVMTRRCAQVDGHASARWPRATLGDAPLNVRDDHRVRATDRRGVACRADFSHGAPDT